MPRMVSHIYTGNLDLIRKTPYVVYIVTRPACFSSFLGGGVKGTRRGETPLRLIISLRGLRATEVLCSEDLTFFVDRGKFGCP